GQRLYSELMAKGGRSAEWATWMWSGGGKRQAPPRSLFTPPSFVTDKASKVHMPTGGWADPLAKGVPRGLALTRALGVGGGVVSTGTGAYNLYQQGNPVTAFD